MNYRLVSILLSVISLTIALAFLCSALVGGWGFGEDAEWTGWLWSIAISLVVAGVFFLLGRGAGETIFRKEALTIIGTGWILGCLLGSLPYLFLLDTTFADAFFESTSGLTTTGASVYANIETFPRGLMFFRCLSQWLGGLGVVVFFVAILSFLGAGAKFLYSNESSAHSADLSTARVQEGVLRIAQLYGVLSLLCFFSLKLCGFGWFDAVCHMFTTVATGGFSTRAASIAAFNNPAAEWVIIVFMTICGTSFLVLLQALGGKHQVWRENTEVKAYYGIILMTVLLLTPILFLETTTHPSPSHAFRSSLFQVVSILTTTGFSTEDFAEWPPVGRILLILMMLLGGCSGSTAGGAKVVRIVAALRICGANIERSFRTHVVRPLQINGRVLAKEDQESIMTFLVMLGLIGLISVPLLAIFEHELSFTGAFSATLSSLFNIGPGLAEVGPTEVYGFLGAPAKLFLSLLMIMGRLELYAILALFAPSLWRSFS